MQPQHLAPERPPAPVLPPATPPGLGSKAESLKAEGDATGSRGANLIRDIAEIREVRTRGLYRETGHHSFRSWCVANFGERLGVWLDEII